MHFGAFHAERKAYANQHTQDCCWWCRKKVGKCIIHTTQVMEKRIDGRRERRKTQNTVKSTPMEWAMWRSVTSFSADLLKSHNFHEKLLFRLVVEVRENIASHRTERKKAFGLILRFTPHVLQVRSNDCITSDRSVDELLMRSHFFTLHRRLSNVSAFQCATNALHYATKNFAFSPTPHNRKTELFCSALAFPNIDALFESNLWAASARMCAWKVMKLVS